MRRVATPIATALAMAALLALVGPAALAAGVGADVRVLALAFTSLSAFFLLRGTRWSLLLRVQARVPTTESAALTAVGWTVSSFVPFKAGDVVRAGWMAGRTRLPAATVAGTVAVERLLDLLGLALACTVGLLMLAMSGWTGPAWASGIVAVAWLLPAALLACAFLVAPRIPGHGRLARTVAQALGTLPALARRPVRLVALAGLTVLVSCTQVATFVLLAHALLPGAALSILVAAAPLFLLTFALPLMPGNLGTYEAGFVAAFSLTGLPASQLVAAAVAAHILGTGMVTLLGGAGLLLLDRSKSPATPERHGNAPASAPTLVTSPLALARQSREDLPRATAPATPGGGA